ncbi:flagellin N-terminal helical domain-containing protein [Rhodopila globiformis]|uniref:Flagellin n=1 Tax=Rhodopila globiformis TaxID=1071 RepID=A0A2S6MV11_RHOGL|nr:flagellin [Rhodopila globiformis]PPQ26203.1 hypothetical protein CCS01_30745 [Rhodopila globiformis]
MSGVGSVGSGYSFLNTLVANALDVHQQLNTLTEQASTGLVAQTYAELGSGASVALDLNPQLATLQTYQNNISQATGRMQVTQTAMTQLQQIAATFVAAMPNLNSTSSQEVDTIAAQARDALVQVANLLDTQDGGVYVFGGQDTANPPVPNPDSILTSTSPDFYGTINQTVSDYLNNVSGVTLSTTVTDAIANAPFSANMQSGTVGQQVVQTQDGSSVRIGLLANQNASAATTSTPTGSYMLDLMRSLAIVGSLSSTQTGDSNFMPLVQDTMTTLNGVVSAMATDVGVLGNRQSALTATQTQLSDTATALTGQVSAVQDADMTTTLSKLTAVQTQLQMSYRMIVSEGTLSLSTYLPVA